MKTGFVKITNIKDLPEIQVWRYDSSVELYSKVWFYDLFKELDKALELIEDLLKVGYKTSFNSPKGSTELCSIEAVEKELKEYLKITLKA